MNLEPGALSNLARQAYGGFARLYDTTSGFMDALDRAREFGEAQRRFERQVLEPFRTISQFALQLPAFDLRQAIRDEHALYRRLGRALLRIGWPPVTTLDLSQIEAIVEMYDEYERNNDERLLLELRAVVEEHLLDHYGEQEVRDILAKWEDHPLLTDRLRILSAAVEAHLEGRYELSVPAILPHVEGILAQGFAHTGRMRSHNYEEYAERLTSDLLRPYDEAIRAFITDYLLATFEWGSAPGSGLSRHAVLHGYDTAYATAANSLKVILVFDHLQDRLRYVTIGSDTLYHVIGCPRLAGIPDADRAYVLPYDAVIGGRDPCPECRPQGQ